MPRTDCLLQTVSGRVLRPGADVRLDGHAHAWIDPRSLAPEEVAPVNDEERLVAGLRHFADVAAPRRAALLDCQPPGCGRDAAALARLSAKSGVAIAAVTGFHLQRYYPQGLRPWTTADAALGTFLRELEGGFREQPMARAAAVKAAHTGTLEEWDPCWEAAVEACRQTGSLLLVHTEAAAGAHELLSWLAERGVPPERVYLCHVDGLGDAAPLAELAEAGALLGFDGFLDADAERSFELLGELLERGHGRSVAIGLGSSRPEEWVRTSPDAVRAAGPAALVTTVEPRLRAIGASLEDVDALLGGTLLERAARTE